MDVEVKVLRDDKSQQILSQYITFCKISNEQVALHGRTELAANVGQRRRPWYPAASFSFCQIKSQDKSKTRDSVESLV